MHTAHVDEFKKGSSCWHKFKLVAFLFDCFHLPKIVLNVGSFCTLCAILLLPPNPHFFLSCLFMLCLELHLKSRKYLWKIWDLGQAIICFQHIIHDSYPQNMGGISGERIWTCFHDLPVLYQNAARVMKVIWTKPWRNKKNDISLLNKNRFYPTK